MTEGRDEKNATLMVLDINWMGLSGVLRKLGLDCISTIRSYGPCSEQSYEYSEMTRLI